MACKEQGAVLFISTTDWVIWTLILPANQSISFLIAPQMVLLKLTTVLPKVSLLVIFDYFAGRQINIFFSVPRTILTHD